MLPPELLPFLALPGRVLLVKGSAGAGKTLLLMELARAYQARGGDVLWVSSRQADPAESIDLEELAPAQHREAAQSDPEAPGSPAHPPNANDSDLLADLERDLDQADSLVIVDSIDGLIEDGAVNAANQFMAKAKGTAMRTGARFAITLESAGPHLVDHLADGVVSLEQGLLEGARIRTLTLDKMRGTQLAQPVYAFTLTGGKFATLSDDARDPPSNRLRAVGRPGRDGFLPTGITAWDALLGGGFQAGTVHLIEFTSNAAADVKRITTPLVLNTLALGKTVVWAAMPNAPGPASRLELLDHVDKAAAKRLAFVQAGDLQAGDHHLERLAPLGRMRRELVPSISILSLDALGLQDEAGAAWLAAWCRKTRAVGAIDLLLANASGPDHSTLTDDKWRVTRMHGVPLLRGIVPQTEHHFLRLQSHKGYPETVLEALQ